jgi:hypothetical protein
MSKRASEEVSKPAVAEASNPIADDAQRRTTDDVMFKNAAGEPAVVSCVHAGKVGKQRSAVAIGGTIFWLTDVGINNLLGRFERNGAVKMIEARMETESALLKLHEASHAVYVARVLPLLSEAQRAFFLATFVEIKERPRKYGNAGVGEAKAVKCLHAQVASALAGAPTPVGCAVVRYMVDIAGRIQAAARAKKAAAKEDDAPGDGKASNVVAGDIDVDDFTNFLKFLDATGPTAFTFDEFDLAAADVCGSAMSVVVAVEGHEPRPRKKNRIN